MRVTLHHFGSNVADHIVKVEPTGFTLELTVERHLKKHITKLLAQQHGVFRIDGFYRGGCSCDPARGPTGSRPAHAES